MGAYIVKVIYLCSVLSVTGRRGAGEFRWISVFACFGTRLRLATLREQAFGFRHTRTSVMLQVDGFHTWVLVCMHAACYVLNTGQPRYRMQLIMTCSMPYWLLVAICYDEQQSCKRSLGAMRPYVHYYLR